MGKLKATQEEIIHAFHVLGDDYTIIKNESWERDQKQGYVNGWNAAMRHVAQKWERDQKQGYVNGWNAAMRHVAQKIGSDYKIIES